MQRSEGHMIKHLSGDYETVEYEEKRCIMLYHNQRIP